MTRSFIAGLLVLAASLVGSSVLAGPKQVLPERFQGKIVTVDVIDGPEFCVLKNVEIDTIGGRVFLVGQRHVSSPQGPDTEGHIAVAWDRVVALKTCEDRPAEASRHGDVDAVDASLETEIERFLRSVKDAESDVRRTMHLIAKEQVELERLSQETAGLETQVVHERRAIDQLKADLARGEESYEYAGKTYTAEQVKQDLAERERRLQIRESTVRQLERACQQRQQSLENAEEMIGLWEQLRATKRPLEEFIRAENTLTEKGSWEALLSEARRLEQALYEFESSGQAPKP